MQIFTLFRPRQEIIGKPQSVGGSRSRSEQAIQGRFIINVHILAQ